MSRIFRNEQELMNDVQRHLNAVIIDGKTLITEELLKDSNQEGYAPKQEGDLIDSSVFSTRPAEGIIRYTVDYARRLYYQGSRSGRVRWIEQAKLENLNKYRRLLNNLFERTR